MIIFFAAEDGKALYSQQKQDQELTVAQIIELLISKFRLKLKKVGKTISPLRHDLNQIPYDYTVEVTNRFTGLDLTECLKNYGWRFVTLYRRQGSRPSPRKRNAKKAKWLSEEALQIAVKRREAKGKGEKERYLNAEFQRIARREKKAFLSDQCKQIEENNTMERLEISSRKLEIPREHFMQRWLDKGQKWYGPNRSRRY